MARKRVVSRTFKATVVQVKAIDVETEQFLNMEFKLTGTFKDEKDILKKVKSLVTNPNINVLKVLQTWDKTLYAVMPEQQFMELATITEINPDTEA